MKTLAFPVSGESIRSSKIQDTRLGSRLAYVNTCTLSASYTGNIASSQIQI